MKRIVITGATGMIGLALIKQCIRNNCEVYAVIRPDSKRRHIIPETESVHIIECDISNITELKNKIGVPCEVFYHLAWSHTGRHKNDDIKYQIDNINYAVDAIRTAKKLGCRLFVGAGSQAEYGPLDIDIISPETPANPRIPYGICKYVAGKLAMIEGDKIGINCVWVRVFSIFGYNDKRESFMDALISTMHNSGDVKMTEGVQLWDYLHCDDAARAFYLVGEKCQKSSVYCLGSGKSRPLKEYVEITAKKLDYKKSIEFGRVPYTELSVMNLCADISSIKEDVGWSPQYTFDEGLDRTIKDKSLLEWR